MKLSIQQTILLLVASVFGMVANAHPGHDHGAMGASAIHVLFYAGIALAVVFAGFVAYKKLANKEKTEK